MIENSRPLISPRQLSFCQLVLCIQKIFAEISFPHTHPRHRCSKTDKRARFFLVPPRHVQEPDAGPAGREEPLPCSKCYRRGAAWVRENAPGPVFGALQSLWPGPHWCKTEVACVPGWARESSPNYSVSLATWHWRLFAVHWPFSKWHLLRESLGFGLRRGLTEALTPTWGLGQAAPPGRTPPSWLPRGCSFWSLRKPAAWVGSTSRGPLSVGEHPPLLYAAHSIGHGPAYQVSPPMTGTYEPQSCIMIWQII